MRSLLGLCFQCLVILRDLRALRKIVPVKILLITQTHLLLLSTRIKKSEGSCQCVRSRKDRQERLKLSLALSDRVGEIEEENQPIDDFVEDGG